MPGIDCPIVYLSQKGDIRQGKLKGATIAAALSAAFKAKKAAPTNLGKYAWKGKTLFLFGYVEEGKAGTENQHHLPPPLEGISFYGDILVLASATTTSYTTPVPFTTTDYEAFYTQRLEGEDEEDEEGETLEGDIEAEAIEEVPEEDEVEDEEDEGDYGDGEDGEEEVEGGGEDEDDEIVPVAKKATPRVRKATKAAQLAAAHAMVELDGPELESDASPEDVPQRQRTLEILRGFFDTLSDEQHLAFESLLYSSSLDTATKEKVIKSWKNSEFVEIYLAVCRKIIGNLNSESYVGNKNLQGRFLAGELTLEQMCKQNYYELFPEHWEAMVDRQAKRERIQLEGDFSRATDRWQCNGCKLRKCTYYELQTRSADEPMTIFIHCLNCGKRWTQ